MQVRPAIPERLLHMELEDSFILIIKNALTG